MLSAIWIHCDYLQDYGRFSEYKLKIIFIADKICLRCNNGWPFTKISIEHRSGLEVKFQRVLLKIILLICCARVCVGGGEGITFKN